MSKTPAPQAEGLNKAETNDACNIYRGGRRSIRKRAYHRALKRGEMRSLTEQGLETTLRVINRGLYTEPVFLSPEQYMMGLSAAIKKDSEHQA